ncbi:MAG: isoprenylcysteine carboxylmethyltransferase family protein [Terracidiphilus sp.]|jgi:protein-S-isoprenylcysteine O-methyltransferase Ste14
MKASTFEFRFRMIIQIVIVFLGFWAPWMGMGNPGRRVATLEWLALQVSRTGMQSFRTAVPTVIVLGTLVALAGAVLRVWGAAYLGYDVVHHGQMQGGAVIAAGPYRHVRNPLYLGGWCMMAAVALLMPPSGALFTVVLVGIFYLRLIFGEEAFLARQLRDPYRDYRRAVPRLVPRLRSNLPRSEVRPQWLVGFLTEVNAIGVFVSIAFLSWTYNNLLMIKAIVVSFGLSLIVRAFMPRGENRARTG